MEDLALRRLFRAAQVDGLLDRFADALGISVRIDDRHGRPLAAAASPAGEGSVETRAGLRIDDGHTGFVVVGSVGGAQGLAALVADVVGRRLAQEIEMRELTAELLNRYEEVNLLYDLSTSLAAVFDVATLCAIAVDRAVGAVGATNATVFSRDPATGRLEVVAARGARPAAAGDRVSSRVADSGATVLLHAGQHGPDDDGQVVDDAVLSVPVLRPGGGEVQVLGVVTVSGKAAGERFSAGDARLATTIATQLGAAIHNSRLVDVERQAARVRGELEIAAGIQRGLLPAVAPEVPGPGWRGCAYPRHRSGATISTRSWRQRAG